MLLVTVYITQVQYRLFVPLYLEKPLKKYYTAGIQTELFSVYGNFFCVKIIKKSVNVTTWILH